MDIYRDWSYLTPRERHIMSNHVMLDLETLALDQRAVIISIGLVLFNEHKILDTLYIKVDKNDQPQRTQDPVVLDWWNKQSDEAKQVLNSKYAVSPLVAIDIINGFLVKNDICKDSLRVWGNGSDFDNVILNDFFNDYNAISWQFRNNRCFRTIKSMFEVDEPKRKGLHHNALDDAIHQVEHLQKILNDYCIPLR